MKRLQNCQKIIITRVWNFSTLKFTAIILIAILMPNIISICQQLLEQQKAENIITIDLTGKFPLSDTMIIASGNSTRHVFSLGKNLIEELAKYHVKPVSVTGMELGDWVLIDLPDVMIHLFRPEIREYYQIEKLWTTI